MKQAISQTVRVAIIIFLFLVYMTQLKAQSTKLEIGKPIEGELKGGESRTFGITLRADEYIFLTAEQKGVDVTVVLLDPNGQELRKVNWIAGTEDPEILTYVTSSAGNYSVVIGATQATAKPGKFELVLKERRTATRDDRLFSEGMQKISDITPLFEGRKPGTVPVILETAKAAEGIFTELIDKKQRAYGLSHVSFALNRAGEFESAARVGSEAANLFIDAGMIREAFWEQLGLGRNLSRSFRTREGLSAYDTALSLSEKLNDKELIFTALSNLGDAYRQIGEFAPSLNFYQKGLDVSYTTKEPRITMTALYNLGLGYTNVGNRAKALAIYNEYQKLQKETGITGNEISVLVNIGNIYSGEGRLDLALQYYQEALKGFRAGGFRVGEAFSLGNIAGIYMRQGKSAEGIAMYQEVLQLKEQIRQPLTIEYMNLGLAYRLTNDLVKAQESYSKALEWANRTGNSYFIGAANRSLGDVLVLQHKLDEAQERADRAMAVAKEREFGDVEGQTLILNANIQIGRGKKEAAVNYLLGAIEIIEAIRKQSGETGGGGFLIVEPYKMLIDIWESEGELEKALALSEQIKARGMVDVLRNSKTGNDKILTADQISEERSLKLEMNALNTRISRERQNPKSNNELISDLQAKLDRKRLDLEDLKARLYSDHPELRIKREDIEPINIADVGQLVGQKTLVIEFVRAEDSLIAFTISPGAGKPTIKSYKIEAKANDLDKKIQLLSEKLEKSDLDFQTISRELYDLLLKPAADQLSTKSRLLIVGDGALWDVPFQALLDEKGRYEVEKLAISYAPSLTALREMTRKAKTRRSLPGSELLAFGNPNVNSGTVEQVQRVFMDEKLEPIPEAERLVNELGKMYGPKRSKIFVGKEAREETAKQEAPKFRIVQFATHGILNNASPMYSHLVLARDEKDVNEDGLLEAWELKDLDLKADMVILTACDTARGRISSGDGIIGMTWAVFIAGAPTTVASQWKVESSSTTELMLEFHRQLLSGKVSKAEALRRAQLKLLRSTKYKHPSYWAPWVLMGDGS